MSVFVNDNPSSGVEGTVVMAEFLNALGLSPVIEAGLRVVSASRAVDPDKDYILLVDASAGEVVLSLPGVAGFGPARRLMIRKADATGNAVVLMPPGGAAIDGQASLRLTVGLETAMIVSDGTNFFTFSFTGYLDGRQQHVTDAAAVTIDWLLGATAVITLDRATTSITLSHGVNGKVYRLKLVQDSAGNRAVSWVDPICWQDGEVPALTNAPGSVDFITLVYCDSTWYGSLSGNFGRP